MSQLPTVVNRHNSPFDLYIGRRSKWGNPFQIIKDGTRAEVLVKYEAWLRSRPRLLQSLHELDGLALGCSCKPKPCHGDILIKLRKEQLNI